METLARTLDRPSKNQIANSALGPLLETIVSSSVVRGLTVVCETKWSETKRMERNEMKICSLRNENSVVCEMKICSLRNENLQLKMNRRFRAVKLKLRIQSDMGRL